MPTFSGSLTSRGLARAGPGTTPVPSDDDVTSDGVGPAAVTSNNSLTNWSPFTRNMEQRLAPIRTHAPRSIRRHSVIASEGAWSHRDTPRTISNSSSRSVAAEDSVDVETPAAIRVAAPCSGETVGETGGDETRSGTCDGRRFRTYSAMKSGRSSSHCSTYLDCAARSAKTSLSEVVNLVQWAVCCVCVCVFVYVFVCVYVACICVYRIMLLMN